MPPQTRRLLILLKGWVRERAHLCGLLDVEDNEGSAFRSGSEAGRSVPGRGVVGGQSESDKPVSGQAGEGAESKVVGSAENTVIRKKKKTPPPSPSLTRLSS